MLKMQPPINTSNATMEQHNHEQNFRTEEPNFFTQTKDLFTNYLSDRITLIKLQTIEKVSTIAAGVVSGILLAFLGIFFLIFASITLGFFLAHLLDSNTAGFGIVAGFYLLLIVLILAFGKKMIGNTVTKKIIQNFFKK